MGEQAVALVTGAARGIGRAIVERLAAQGHAVAFTYREDVAAAFALLDGPASFAIKADAADSELVQSAVETVIDRYGRLDALVNNCGVSVYGAFDAVPFARYEHLMQVNLMGAMRACHAAVPHMVRRRAGAIVNISSIWGRQGASCESVYSASKAGLESFSRSLAKELGPSGVRVNVVAPGVVDTAMNGRFDEDERNALAGAIPLGRFADPSEIASAVWFLLSSQASFITGETLRVSGGQD